MAVSEAEKRASRKNTCGGCDATWTGAAQCHCTGCHQTFSSLTGFDAHRAGKKPRNGKGYYRPSGQCYSPADSGLVQNDKGLWAYPGDPDRTYGRTQQENE